MFGGDTKIEENDALDDSLYLLNTTSLKWTVANPKGRRPTGRYGHTISTIGSVLYVFGGQLDDNFHNDLVSFDLTTLQSPDSCWNFIKPNSPSPPARTNHTVVSFQDKLYLFGGTDGKLWYSDTWVYNPVDNTWTALECAGFIPAPCEGHSATIVGDTMYIFGGRSSEGKDLGTLSALKIPARKWFSFQNMGPGPSPRSGHTMTAFANDKILVMGGESPDMEQQNMDAGNGPESNNVVYVLDTARISYPPNANEQPEVLSESTPQVKSPVPAANGLPPKVPALIPIAANGSNTTQNSSKPVPRDVKPEELLSKDRSESVLSDLTPGYGYERVNVGGPEKEDSITSEDESVTHKSDKVITPASSRPESIPSDMSKRGTESPFSVDTVRADSPAEHDEKQALPLASIEDLHKILEQFKASNSWYETELKSAQEKGFTPSTRPPVDVLKLRRVSQRITMDTDQSLSERVILVEALSELKEELNEVQQNVQHQAEQASKKIAEAEADRDDAFERMKLLEAQLMAAKNTPPVVGADGQIDGTDEVTALKAKLDDQTDMRVMFFGTSANSDGFNPAVELEKVRSDNFNLEQQVRSFSDKNILIQHESTRYKAQLDDLMTRYRTLEESTDTHVKSLAATSIALSAAQTRASEYSNLLAVRNNERTTMMNETNLLRSELETTKLQLEEATQQLEEHKVLLTRSTEQATVSSAALADGIDQIALIWAGSKLFKRQAQKAKRQNRSRDLDSESLTEPDFTDDSDPEKVRLEKELKEVTQLYETHQRASDNATRELSTTLQQVSFFKQELVSSEETRESLKQQLESALEDLKQMRSEFQVQISENKKSLDSFTESAKEKSSQTELLVEDLRKQLQENEERYNSMEEECDRSAQCVRNSDKALTKTRDELARFKDINTKLQSEIDELRLRLQDQEENDDTASVASSTGASGGMRSRTDHRVGTPPAKYNSRQFDLQLRDLRAQIIILQEERDELRGSTLEVKKKLITNREDLKDAQELVEQLEQENSTLMKRVRDAEERAAKVGSPGDRGSLGRHSYGAIDSDQGIYTLDSLTSELDQMRHKREQSGGFKSDI